MSDLKEHLATTEREVSPSPAKKSGKGRILLVLIILVVAAVGAFIYLRHGLAGTQSTDDASIAGNHVVVSAQILGRIDSMSAKEGARVTGGEKLVTLDDASLQARAREAEANQELAEKNVTLARIKLAQATSDEARGKLQFENKIISGERFDHLHAATATARAGYEIALAQEKLAATQLSSADAELSQTRITSPISGVVAKKWVTTGDVVQPAQSIYTLIDLDHVWVVANFKETQLIYLSPGQKATITVDAVPGKTFTGRVENIGAGTASQFALLPPDNASGNFTKITQRVPVMISINQLPNTDAHLLLPGMSAEVRVDTGKE